MLSHSLSWVGHVSGFGNDGESLLLEFQFPLEVCHAVDVVRVILQADSVDGYFVPSSLFVDVEGMWVCGLNCFRDSGLVEVEFLVFEAVPGVE